MNKDKKFLLIDTHFEERNKRMNKIKDKERKKEIKLTESIRKKENKLIEKEISKIEIKKEKITKIKNVRSAVSYFNSKEVSAKVVID